MRTVPLGPNALHGSLGTIRVHLNWIHHFYNPSAREWFKDGLSIGLRQIRVTKRKDN